MFLDWGKVRNEKEKMWECEGLGCEACSCVRFDISCHGCRSVFQAGGQDDCSVHFKTHRECVCLVVRSPAGASEEGR